MNQADMTRAMNQARRDYDMSRLVDLEVSFIAAMVGLSLHSWVFFLAAWIGLIVALRVRFLGSALSIVLSVLWGVFGWQIGSAFHAGIVPHVALAILGFVIAFGAHKGHRNFWS